MGIFNLFKKKKDNQPKTQSVEENTIPQVESTPITESPVKEESSTAEKEPYYGNLQHTQFLLEMLQIPHEKRDQEWERQFLQYVLTASFKAGTPQIIEGPDGFPYFQLFLPEPNKEFQCFVLEHMIDDFLLKEGFGVVINPQATGADWVFSYGDLSNMKLNNQFYGASFNPFKANAETEVITEEEQVMIGQPVETILPSYTRAQISKLLKLNGIEHPKVLLMIRPKHGDQHDLVFNVTPHQFANEQQFQQLMRTISWYLPRHYTFMGMEESTMAQGFEPL